MIKTRFGAALWIFCLQYFAAEAIAIHAWPGGYSLSRNYISDLGALGCGIHAAGIAGATETLCSPMHAVMNGAFVLQGVLILAGAAMVSSGFSKGVMGVLALVLIGVSGLGVALVGLARAWRSSAPLCFNIAGRTRGWVGFPSPSAGSVSARSGSSALASISDWASAAWSASSRIPFRSGLPLSAHRFCSSRI